MTKQLHSRILLATLTFVFLSGTASHTRANEITPNLVTFAFEATLLQFPYGNLLTGTYTFDSTVSNSGGTNGVYKNAVTAINISIGDLTARIKTGSTGTISILPDGLLNGQYAVLGNVPGGIPLEGDTVNSVTLSSFGFQLYGTFLPVTEFPPTSPPSFSTTPVGLSSFVGLGYKDQGSPIFISEFNAMNSVTSIPEPASVSLIGLALFAVLLFVRRDIRQVV